MSNMRVFIDLWDEDDDKATSNLDRPSTTEPDNRPLDVSIDVPEWTMHDVIEWITRIGYSEFIDRFKDKGVDGDLLLSLNEKNLRFSIGIESSLLLQRFMREITNLKRSTSFSSQDPTNLRSFLMSIDPEFSVYTHPMLKAGVDRCCLTSLSEYQLIHECKIMNSIHRRKILDAINNEKQLMENSLWNGYADEKLDGFISYRRSNGSEFASLLHLKLEHLGYSIFLDTERLGPGKFDNNLKQNIKRAKNFLLVLTQNSLDRCIGDDDCNDWVHKEIVTALEYNCNVIPVLDNFRWPDADALPEDMRAVAKYSGIVWEHERVDESVRRVDKLMWTDAESDAVRSGRSASLSLTARPGADRCERPVKAVRSAPCTPTDGRKSWTCGGDDDGGATTDPSRSRRGDHRSPSENSVVNRNRSSSKLPSGLSPDLSIAENMDGIIEYTGIACPSNELKDNLKIEMCVEVGESTSQIEDTINNKCNVQRIIQKLRRPFQLLKKKHP